MVDTQGVDLKGPQRELAIARWRLLRCWLRRLGLPSRGTEQAFQRAQVVFILDLAHNLFQDVLQRDESQNPPVLLTQGVKMWLIRKAWI